MGDYRAFERDDWIEANQKGLLRHYKQYVIDKTNSPEWERWDHRFNEWDYWSHEKARKALKQKY